MLPGYFPRRKRHINEIDMSNELFMREKFSEIQKHFSLVYRES